MKDNKNEKIIMIVTGVLITVFVLGGIYFTLSSKPKTSSSNEQIKALAQCLTDKGFSMYGAAWCSHCKDEKEAFGEAFNLIKYVECPDNQKLCEEKGVVGYPTWIGVGTTTIKLEGFQTLAKLAEVSGCVLPQ